MRKIILLRVYENDYHEESVVYKSLPADTKWVDMKEEDFQLLKECVNRHNRYYWRKFEYRFILIEYDCVRHMDTPSSDDDYVSIADFMEKTKLEIEQEEAKKAEQKRINAEKALAKKRKKLEQLKQELGEK